MSFLDLPNELLLQIALDFDCKDLNSLLRVNRRTCFLFTQSLQRLAVEPKGGLSALQWAASKGYYSLAVLAIDSGLWLDERCEAHDRTPLHFAISGAAPKIAKLLLDRGADPNARNDNGSTPLHWAAMCGMHDVCQALIAAGADTTLKNNDGVTPLHCAVEGGAEAFVRLLDELDVHACSDIDTSEVSVPKEENRRRVAVVRLLLDNDSRVNARDSSGYTALHFAAMVGKRKVVNWLLEEGADAYVKDRDRSTALDIAEALGHKKVVALLQDHYQKNTEPLWSVVANNILDIIGIGMNTR